MSIVLALDVNRSIYYRVLALNPAHPDDDKSWSDRKKLSFPDQIRPAGMSLVTVGLKTADEPVRPISTGELTADAPFQAVSDGKHVYLFRQSKDGTLYMDRFVFDQAAKTLNPSWEPRYQRSRKRDLPASRKDTLGARDMEGEPFFEPTTELSVVEDLQNGRFCVLLLPGPLPSQWRWQILVTNSEGEIDSYSIRRGEDGLFDMADMQRCRLKWADVEQRFQTRPAALLYMQQEKAQDEYGRTQHVKRGARVMLATSVGHSRYALELDGKDDYVSLGNPEDLQLEGAITIEAWIKAKTTVGRQDIVALGAGGAYLRIENNKYKIGNGDQYASYDIPKEDTNIWIHLAGAYDSEKEVWLLIRNGEQVAQEPDSTGAVTVDEEWAIGRFFNGQINNVRLWNCTRSEAEIQQNLHRHLTEDEPGLVGCWPFDEGLGDIVYDRASQGSENHGRLQLGYGLQFDGLDDHVTLPELDLDLANGFTVEAWVRYSSFQSWSRIIDFGNGDNADNILFANQGRTNDLVFRVYQDQTVKTLTAPAALETGTWMHLAATVDSAGNAFLYKNGQELFRDKIHAPEGIKRTRNFIGRSNWQVDGYFDGNMAEVRIWNLARTQEDIQKYMHRHLAGNEDGLASYWPLDEGVGDTIHEKVSGNDGQLHVGYALEFDGMDDHVALPNMNPILANGFTVEAWVRYRSFKRWSRIIDFGNGESGHNILFANRELTNDLEFQVYKPDVSWPPGWGIIEWHPHSIIAPGVLETGIWMHLAATVDSNGHASLYKNGEQLITDTIQVPTTVQRTKNYIGRSNWAGDGCFDGDMAEVRVWNLARTQDEIQQDMHHLPAEDEPGLLGYWLFEEGAGAIVRDRASGKHGRLRFGDALDDHALLFDGADDYLHMKDFEWPDGGPVTVEFWAKVNAADVRRSSAFTVGEQDNPNRFHVHLPWDNKHLYWDYGDLRGAGRVEVDFSPYLSQWTHVALVSEGNEGGFMGIYLDGELVAINTSSDGPDVPLEGLWIGKWGLFGNHKGGITDFRIWNRVRRTHEIRADMHHRLVGDEDGLVGYWPLDEGVGKIVFDQTSGHHDGQLDVGPEDNSDDKWGKGTDSLDDKWGISQDNPDDKWQDGPEDPNDKWVVVPPIAILDFAVSRQGTLALLGDMENHSELILTQSGGDNAALLPVPDVVAGETRAPFPTVAVDKAGLSISAGLLDFAHSGETPFLLDGADGLVHLYFRGDYGHFLVAQFDTLTARAKYTLPIDSTDDGPQLHFVAVRPGSQMNGYEIAITHGSEDDFCRVVIDNQNGVREVWQDVPRELNAFLAVLIGAATKDANDPQVHEGKLVLYDYYGSVKRDGAPDLTAKGNPFFGSTLFAVGADNLPDDTGAPLMVGNGEAVEINESSGQDCAWIREPQGNALRFYVAGDHVVLPHGRLAITGDLSVEAWVNPAVESGLNQRVINYHHSERSRFTLGLRKEHEKDNFYKVFAASKDMAVQTAAAHVSSQKWTHLAAVYNATNALKLDEEKGYVDCGNDVTLDMTEAMTVEARVIPDRTESEQVILSKWGSAVEEQSWRLYLNKEGKPCFETRDLERGAISVKANVPLETGKPYHLAGAFDALSRIETALELNVQPESVTTPDYVEIPNYDSINFGKDENFTIAVWIKTAPEQIDTTVIDNMIVEKSSGEGGYPFVIRYLNRTHGEYAGKIIVLRHDGNLTPYIMSNIVVNDGSFHHVAFVKQGSTLYLYIDGWLEGTTPDTTTGKTKNDSPLYVGIRGGENYPFSGQINHLRIWNRALSIEEIGEDMDRPTREVEGAVGNWAFDFVDKLAEEVKDHSSNQDGTLCGNLKGGSFIEVDKCRYEQKIWVDGDLHGWRWVTIDDGGGKGPGYLDNDKLTLSETNIKLRRPNNQGASQDQIKVGDCLLLLNEQVLVTHAKEINRSNRWAFYDLVVERAINGIAREHRRDTKVHFLKRAANEVACTTTRVNIGRAASDEQHFQGVIDDVRLWEVGRREWQIRHYQDHPLPGNAGGLVGDWRFEEGRGKTAFDSKGSNHGRLVHPEPDKVEQMWIPAARNARLTLYVNGRNVKTIDDRPDGLGPTERGSYGAPNQFTIGAVIDYQEMLKEQLSGTIDELRVWSDIRTTEQIRDNMYRALTGDEEGLEGYWPLDEREGDTAHDRTGNGQHGTVTGPEWVVSTAPIGNEGPEVRNVYGGLAKPGFNKGIAGPPAAVEYGDMQWDDEGNLFGVMKRCYVFQDDALQLATGFKVGDLELNFIGQVQTAPTLIGYIEGAPPVPSENLTVNDPVTDDYVGTSSLQLAEAKETTQIYSASRDTGFDMSMDLKAGVFWKAGASAGFGVETEVFSTTGKVGVHAYLEHSLGYLSSASKTAGISRTLTKTLTLGGGWEEKQDYDQNDIPRYVNLEVGQRYLPNNMGYALVKSGTADLFALRLKRTGSLVAFHVLPNPDIPEDWNIIMFPLNPKYVKNGTLDGMVGLDADPDYPRAKKGERGSYFKPLEAYALKEQIEREAKKITGYYATFDENTAKKGTGDDGLSSELPGAELGYDWETGRDKRSMANTYVWTADGGFYAEEEQFSSIRQESLGSSYQFLGQGGIYTDLELAVGSGIFLEVDALFGGHINTTVSKSKEEKAAFGLHIDVQGEGFLNRWEGDADKQEGHYTAEPCPGKVDAYRFMTFYLAPKPQNFDRFFEEIVDPEWLNGQGKYAAEYGANARALRQARSKPNEVWRVLHRVTYVSRIPPQGEPTPVEAVPKDVRRPANIEANIGLIREIERIKHLTPPSPEETKLMILGRAVDRLLFADASGNGQGQSELEKITSWWAGRVPGVKREIRQDLMTYLKAFYESDLTPPEIETEKQRVTEGLQVLYTFEEETGNTVHDVSDVGEPLDLIVKDPEEVSWIHGGLTITGETIVATSGPAAKLIKAAKASNEITIETWLKPTKESGGGLARIVTLSADKTERNFTLIQHKGRYRIRLRTTKTNDNGTKFKNNESESVLEAGKVATILSHLVYTRDASGRARFYVNGEQVGDCTVAGDFSNWNGNYRLGLGNEFKDERPWLGELHLVAIYNRALRPDEIKQNYSGDST
jgi:hypothetical protein